MKIRLKNCYKDCISKNFLIPEKLIEKAEKILSKFAIQSKLGHPTLEKRRLLQGTYYLLRTGIHWKAIPKCFGSSSALHRFFYQTC